jgi:hypothetical protein
MGTRVATTTMAQQQQLGYSEIARTLERAVEVRRAVRAHAFNAALFARAVLGITPDPLQARVLRTGARQVILNCSRQWGKSTLAAIKLIHIALTRPSLTTRRSTQSGNGAKRRWSCCVRS